MKFVEALKNRISQEVISLEKDIDEALCEVIAMQQNLFELNEKTSLIVLFKYDGENGGYSHVDVSWGENHHLIKVKIRNSIGKEVANRLVANGFKKVGYFGGSDVTFTYEVSSAYGEDDDDDDYEEDDVE